MPHAVMSDRDIFEYASYLGFGKVNQALHDQAQNKSTNLIRRMLAEERLND